MLHHFWIFQNEIMKQYSITLKIELKQLGIDQLVRFEDDKVGVQKQSCIVDKSYIW